MTPAQMVAREVKRSGLTQDQFAEWIGTHRVSINQLVQGKRNITAEMALRLQHYTGLSAFALLRAQMRQDLAKARKKLPWM